MPITVIKNGDILTLEFDVINNNINLAIANVTSTFTVGAGMTLDSVVSTGAGSFVDPVFTTGTLAAGTTDTLTATVTVVDSSGDLTLQCVVATTDTESDTGNNTITKDLVVEHNGIRCSDLNLCVDLSTHSVTELNDVTDAGSGAIITTAERDKVGHLTVTQAVDLDTMESDVSTNNAKVTNATHTGDVTGATALTLAATAISGQSTHAGLVGTEEVLINDGGLFKITTQAIADLGAGIDNSLSEVNQTLTSARTVTHDGNDLTFDAGLASYFSVTGGTYGLDILNTLVQMYTPDGGFIGNASGVNVNWKSGATDGIGVQLSNGLMDLVMGTAVGFALNSVQGTVGQVPTAQGTGLPLIWSTPGDMLKATYDPNTVNGDAFDMDNMVEGATTKILTDTERSEIAANTLKNTNVSTNLSFSRDATTVTVESSDGTNAILPEADTTNAGVLGSDKWDEIVANSLKLTADTTNVDAAGAVMESDTSTASMSFVIDEDDMSSDSDTKVPTQQSVKAYVDGAITDVNEYTFTNSAAGNYTVLTTDHVILKTGITGTTGDVVTLPSAPNDGKIFVIKDANGGAGTDKIQLTVAGGVINIDGATTQDIVVNYGYAKVMWNGSKYVMLNYKLT